MNDQYLKERHNRSKITKHSTYIIYTVQPIVSIVSRFTIRALRRVEEMAMEECEDCRYVLSLCGIWIVSAVLCDDMCFSLALAVFTHA